MGLSYSKRRSGGSSDERNPSGKKKAKLSPSAHSSASLPRLSLDRISPVVFFRQDIETARLLLPLLTDDDRRNLSACCSSMVNYHHHLSRIHIVPQRYFHHAARRALSQLLSRQQGDAEVTKVEDPSAMLTLMEHRRLDRTPWRVKELDLTNIAISDRQLTAWDTAMHGGVLVRLEGINLSGVRVSNIERFRRFMSSFQAAGGQAPSLRQLNMANLGIGMKKNIDHDEIGIILGEAMRELPSTFLTLEELNISSNSLEESGLLAVTTALGQGACPQLKVLDISFNASAPAQNATATAMSLGSLICLEKLEMGGGFIGDELMSSLASGKCPNLRSLSFFAGGSCESLTACIASGAIPLLERLDMLSLSFGRDCGNAGPWVPLINALEVGG